MKALIKNLIPIIENEKTVGLRLDVENATDLEINVYVSYMQNRITSDTVMCPMPFISSDEKERVVVEYGHHQNVEIVVDWLGCPFEYRSLANLHNIAIISVEGSGFVSRIMDLKDDQIVQKEGFEDCVGRSNFYARAGILAYIAYREKQNPEKMADLLDSQIKSNEKGKIVFS